MATRQMECNKGHNCEVCGTHFDSVRYNATICSDKCRQRKSRKQKRIVELLAICDGAINELMSYKGHDGEGKAFDALEHIGKRATSAAGYFDTAPGRELKQLPIPEEAYTIGNTWDGKPVTVEQPDDLDPDMVAKKFGYDIPAILAYFNEKFVALHGHRWAWGNQAVEKKGTEYYLRPKDIYLGHYMEAVVAMANFVLRGKVNAAEMRAWQTGKRKRAS